jgi:hypothetical protein
VKEKSGGYKFELFLESSKSFSIYLSQQKGLDLGIYYENEPGTPSFEEHEGLS